MPNLYVQRDFHVYVAPAREGEKETRKDFRAGELIECTAEQEKVGRDTGLLGDTDPTKKPEPTTTTTSASQEE